MNDDQFFDLALRVIVHQASEAERAELATLIARQPELKAEFERLQADTRLAREVLPLVNATEATAPELPTWARARLQTKVRQTLGRLPSAGAEAEDANRRMMWRWRWVVGLATVAAAVALIVVPLVQRAPAPVFQVAMLDTGGGTRGADAGEQALLRQAWSGAVVASFSSSESARAWQTNWPADGGKAIVKVLYDRPAGELRVLGRWKGVPFQGTFVVEQDFAVAVNRAKAFIQEQTKR
jgi:hypothetical protein